jgi:predicted  nucleic acid-binding Zn-ribbon protein
MNTGDEMKTDLNSLKKELSRLTDTKYLKKEIGRITNELKTFDMGLNLNSQARSRLDQLEKRFRELMNALTELQKQVDVNFEKMMSMVRRSTAGSKKTTQKKPAAARKKNKKKSPARSPGKASKKTSRRSVSR